MFFMSLGLAPVGSAFAGKFRAVVFSFCSNTVPLVSSGRCIHRTPRPAMDELDDFRDNNDPAYRTIIFVVWLSVFRTAIVASAKQGVCVCSK